MEFTSGDSERIATLRRWNRVLAVLAWLGLLWSSYSILYSIHCAITGTDFALGMKTTAGIKLLTADDFSTFQRLIVVLCQFPQELFWIFCMWQIVRLSRLFSSEEVLSLSVIKCLERFAFALAGLGLAAALYAPMLVVYLVELEKIDGVENIWQDMLGNGLSTLMIAVLLTVVTRILRIGVRLREEADLTI